MEVILIGKKIPSKLCELLFLPHFCNVDKQDFFNPMKDQIIQILKKKTMVFYGYRSDDRAYTTFYGVFYVFCDDNWNTPPF